MNKSKDDKAVPTPLGNFIRSQRQKHNLSQHLLAEQLGVSHAYIGFLEKGQRNGSDEMLEKLAHFFSIEPLELLKLRNQKSDMLHELAQVPKGATYPSHITEFADMLNQIEEETCKGIIEEFKEQLQKKLYHLLTPYDLKSVKSMVKDVKRSWLRLIQPDDQIPSLCKDVQGYITQNDKDLFFHFHVDESALVISLLHPDQGQITTFEHWIGEYSIRFLQDMQFVHLSQSQKVSSFIWFSPSISTLDKYQYLLSQGMNLDKVDCAETQLNWYIQQYLLEQSNDASAS